MRSAWCKPGGRAIWGRLRLSNAICRRTIPAAVIRMEGCAEVTHELGIGRIKAVLVRACPGAEPAPPAPGPQEPYPEHGDATVQGFLLARSKCGSA